MQKRERGTEAVTRSALVHERDCKQAQIYPALWEELWHIPKDPQEVRIISPEAQCWLWPWWRPLRISDSAMPMEVLGLAAPGACGI